jgi:hypothetical protein
MIEEPVRSRAAREMICSLSEFRHAEFKPDAQRKESTARWHALSSFRPSVCR